jgi:hypothetical protein
MKQIADLTAKLAEAERERDDYKERHGVAHDNWRHFRAKLAEVERERDSAAFDKARMLDERQIFLKGMDELRDEVSRLRELREVLRVIKAIVSDKFLHKHEKLEVIESRCDISLCNEALAKSGEP